MKQGWEIKSLMEIASVSTGKWDANHATENGDYRFYTCAYDYLYCDTKRFEGECLILPGNGVNVGEVFYYDGEFDAYQRTYVISDIKILPKYLHYHMLLHWKSLGTKQQYGSATNFIKIGNFKEYDVEYPPLPEQQRIVSILDECFAAIAKAKANAEQNLQNAKQLFESYLQSVFENKGDGWEEKKLGEVCDIKHGYAFEGDDFETDFSGSNPIVLTPGNFKEDCKLSFTNKNTKRCKTEYPKDYLFSVGELVVVMTDLSSLMKILGKPAIIDRDDILHNQRIGRFVFKEDSIEKSYLFYFLQTNKYLNKVKESATGTMVRHTAPKRILNIEIQFPKSLKEQQTIVRQLDALRAETQKLEAVYHKKLEDLEELKKSVLQKAFNGEL